jgi:single-stranded-DNA-specific exonuclease
MQMPVGYVTTDLVHQFSCLAPFGKDNPRPIFVDRDLSIRRMWVVGKNRNVLRLNLHSAEGLPLTAVYFGDIEGFCTYFAEKFGQAAVDLAMEGRENPIRLAMVYVPKIDTYRETENLQFEIKYFR